MPTLSYQEALMLLLEELNNYQGEEVPKHEGETEHPLHLAVRNVEAHCPQNQAGYRPLPITAWVHWFDILGYCRELGIKTSWYGSQRRRNTELAISNGVFLSLPSPDYLPVRQPEAAKAAALRLAEWAMGEIDSRATYP